MILRFNEKGILWACLICELEFDLICEELEIWAGKQCKYASRGEERERKEATLGFAGFFLAFENVMHWKRWVLPASRENIFQLIDILVLPRIFPFSYIICWHNIFWIYFEYVCNIFLLQVPLWGVDEVVSWVTRSGFQDYGPAFRECGVDGDMLLQVSTLNFTPFLH